MLFGQQDAVMGAFKIVEMQVQHPAALIEKPFVKARQVGIAARHGDGHVKLLVGLGHVQVVATLYGGFKRRLRAGDAEEVIIGAQFGG